MAGFIKKSLCLAMLAVSCTACLNYTNRVSYKIGSELNKADSTAAFSMLVSLYKQPTSHFGPVATFGQRGNYMLAIQLFGKNAQNYQQFILKSAIISTPTGLAFQTADSTFIQYVNLNHTREETGASGQSLQFYRSPAVVQLADTVNYLSFEMDYLLITKKGAREAHRLRQKFMVEREKGWSLPSI